MFIRYICAHYFIIRDLYENCLYNEKRYVCICSFIGHFEFIQIIVSFYENKMGQYTKQSLKTVSILFKSQDIEQWVYNIIDI